MACAHHFDPFRLEDRQADERGHVRLQPGPCRRAQAQSELRQAGERGAAAPGVGQDPEHLGPEAGERCQHRPGRRVDVHPPAPLHAQVRGGRREDPLVHPAHPAQLRQVTDRAVPRLVRDRQGAVVFGLGAAAPVQVVLVDPVGDRLGGDVRVAETDPERDEQPAKLRLRGEVDVQGRAQVPHGRVVAAALQANARDLAER